MLTLLILIPILGVFCLLPIHSAPISFSPSYASSPSALSSVASVEARQESFGKIEEESNKKMKKIALTTSLINLFVSLFIWFEFDSSTTQFQFVSEFNQLNFCHLNFGIDGVSLFFVLLTTFVTPIALLSNYINLNKNLKLFLISLLLLESLQICAFVSLDLLLFYIFFESVLPLLFIVILIFGHGKDKVRSAQLLFLYTLAGSLPMLLCILGLFSYIGSTDFQLISLYGIKLDSQIWLWLGFFLAFAVKTPLFPFIIWLPKAHSDSPLAGSILLAATILKLATYGYFRVLINYFPDATYFLSPLIMTIGAISLIYASLTYLSKGHLSNIALDKLYIFLIIYSNKLHKTLILTYLAYFLLILIIKVILLFINLNVGNFAFLLDLEVQQYLLVNGDYLDSDTYLNDMRGTNFSSTAAAEASANTLTNPTQAGVLPESHPDFLRDVNRGGNFALLRRPNTYFVSLHLEGKVGSIELESSTITGTKRFVRLSTIGHGLNDKTLTPEEENLVGCFGSSSRLEAIAEDIRLYRGAFYTYGEGKSKNPSEWKVGSLIAVIPKKVWSNPQI
uniref:NADH-ubiquinone oxidoreductase chain 4 n=1 Tax=Tephrocybe rancida TaxID=117070 RepID=A0A386TY87_9AGAR|nr:hypothetical protein DXG01_000015 [Tephrocybe rancida]AYE93170.1 hypothetical protein DXG01_000015 [Tephrocybe rancida]